MSDTEAVIRHLAQQEVGFYAKHDTPGGQRTVHLDVEDVMVYAADPAAFLARYYGVSKADYLGWHRSEYRVICAGKTVKGKPCKASVSGMTLVESPAAWARHQGEYCSIHGGAGSSEVDKSERFR